MNPAIASAAKKIAGRNAMVAYDLSQADVIVSLESDFMNTGPAMLAYARQFAARRAVDNGANSVPAVCDRIIAFGQRLVSRSPLPGEEQRDSRDCISTREGMRSGGAGCAGHRARMAERGGARSKQLPKDDAS